MKKYMVLCAGLGLAMAFTSCKSSESAYRKAYDKAKAAEAAQNINAQNNTMTETPVVTPVQPRPVTQTTVVNNVENVPVRQERVSVVNGTGLRAFSVVVGSFKVVANAEGLQQRLKNAGYAAQIVKNVDRDMYRVVASTFDDKSAAVASRNQLRGTEFNKDGDAWLLSNMK